MQIQNQFGRDDTIDPYYLNNKKGTIKLTNSNGSIIRYTLERKIGNDGQIYYQLVEIDGDTSTISGVNISFAAQDLLYDSERTIKFILDNLIEKDEETQETLSKLNNVIPNKYITFEDLGIETGNTSLSEIIDQINQKEFDSNMLIAGILDSTALPIGVSTASVEIKSIKTSDGTYYEIDAYSDYVEPYKWTALYKNNNCLLNWTSAYGGDSNVTTVSNLQNVLVSHINDSSAHVTDEERLVWNNHVGVSFDQSQDALIFTH